jgi:hypothetical protein
VTAPVDHHGALLLRPAHLRNGCTDTGQPPRGECRLPSSWAHVHAL